MNSKDQKAKEIFLQLISNIPPEDWEERAIAASAGDEDLRGRVRALLRAHVATDSILDDPPPIDQLEPTLPLAAIEKTSAQIGPYKLLQQIGEGGMGVVYMAEQKEPVSRRVALKIIKPGMDNRQVIARFEAERQALAMMDHPNIAKVLDAGTTDQGSPYFVMELVQGIPLTRYCDQNKLSISERLELFIPVCQAVQHAHQKGIIHRDLKPSNVLVCLYDGRPVAKVIDFGLAKALQQQTKLTDKTMFTEFGQVVGTLQYMSPEQAEMNQLDVDTRTDIYSLGVMLYELLTGSTPIDQETLKQQAILQILATIREKDPPRPSVRLGSSANDVVEGISQQRQIDPIKLQSILRGELDWIVMKALEKDRTRRYETASNFAKDIENYLTGNVVAARPPSTAYRVRKYVSKHKGLVSSLVSIAVLLVAGIIGTSIGLFRANEARIEADEARFNADRERKLVVQKNEEVLKEKAKVQEEKSIAVREREKAERTLARSNYFLAIARWNENRVKEANELLARIPPKLRKTEWYLLRRKFQGSYMTCYGHLREVNCVDFSPTGEMLASGSKDGTVRVWDAVTGYELHIFPAAGASVTSIAFSPDGKKLGCSTDADTMMLWDTTTGESILKRKGQTTCVNHSSFSPDGSKLISGSIDGTVHIWNATTGHEIETIQAHNNMINFAAFSPDGKIFLSSSPQDYITLWDAQTRRKMLSVADTIPVDELSSTTSAGFSRDGSRVFASRFQSMWLWDTATGKEFLPGIYTGINVRLSPDGKRSAGSDGNVLKVCDITEGKSLHDLVAGNEFVDVNCVSFCPDGKIVAAGYTDGLLRIWDIDKGTEIVTLKGHIGEVRSICFSPDGSRVVSAGSDKAVKVWALNNWKEPGALPLNNAKIAKGEHLIKWADANGSLEKIDLATGERIWRTRGHDDIADCFAVDADGSMLATGARDHLIRLYDASSGEELFTLRGHTNIVTELAFSADGRTLVSGSRDQSVRVWNSHTGREVRTLLGHTSEIGALAVSSDGSRIVSQCREKTKFWDSISGQEFSLKSYSNARTFRFSTDGLKLLTGELDGSIRVFATEDGELLSEFHAHSDDVTCLAFSPDSKILLSGSADKTIKIWDIQTLREIGDLKGHLSEVESLALSADGARAVSLSQDGEIKLWDIDYRHEVLSTVWRPYSSSQLSFSTDGTQILVDGAWIWDGSARTELNVLAGHGVEMTALAFSQNGNLLAIGDEDGLIKIWETETGEELHAFKGSASSVRALDFSPDGTQIVTGFDDGTIKVWDAGSTVLLRTLDGHEGAVLCLKFMPHGSQLISGGTDMCLKSWDLDDGRLLRTLKGHAERITCLSISDDGSRLVTGSYDKSVRIWEIDGGLELKVLQGHKELVSDVGFSRDGKRVYSHGGIHYPGYKQEFIVWDAESGSQREDEVWAHNDARVAKSADGRWMVTEFGDHVYYVDLHFQKQAFQQRLRMSSAIGLHGISHAREFIEGLSTRSSFDNDWLYGNSYFPLFHAAWDMKRYPEYAWAYDQLHEAYALWQDEWIALQEEADRSLAPDDYKREFAKPNPDLLLAPFVREMLALPRGTKELASTEMYPHIPIPE